MKKMVRRKKILITGASGFIGSHLVELLLKEGVPSDSLRLFIAPWDTPRNLPYKSLEIITGDIRKKNDVKKAVKRVDIVYHLAAKTTTFSKERDYYRDTNVLGTRYLLKEAAVNKVRKFIFFSSISVFGLPAYAGDMENFSETSPKNPSEPYGRSKLKAEKEVIKANKKWGLPYIIIRPTTVYGPKDKGGVFQLFKVLNKGLFVFIGNAQNKMDYVYVEDVVKAARLAEQSQVVNEDFIIGSEEPVTQKELVDEISRSIGKKVKGLTLPKKIALPASVIIQSISRLLGLDEYLFPERVKVLTSNCYFDVSKAKKVLGYKQEVTLRKGIKLTAAWLRDNDYI